jgi:hypothetical protein
MWETDDVLVIDEMQRTGGGFVRALGFAASKADRTNLERIKEAFPGYWSEYRERALQRARDARRQTGRDIP